MTARRASFIATFGTAAAATLIDPVRIFMTAVALREARRANPELFDGSLAVAAINAAIQEDSAA